MEKVLSIIIPTYNAEKFLDRGLSSMILAEAEWMDKLEVIIVNDGSPDDSVRVAQKYVDRYPNTFWILNKENGGHGSGINAGVKEAKGTYFKVIDADDWVDTGVLLKILQILEEEEPVDALVQSYRKYDVSLIPEELVETGKEPEAINGMQTGIEHLSVLLEEGIYTLSDLMNHWREVVEGMCFHGILYRTDFYRNFAGDDGYRLIEGVFYEDHEFATIPMAHAKTVRIMRDELYVYRVGDMNQSVSVASSERRKEHYHAVIMRLLDFEEKMKNNQSECPAGGEAYWIRKTSKFIADTLLIFMIRVTDKKKYRIFCRDLMEEIHQKSERVYTDAYRKYRVFCLLNRVHMSDERYHKHFLPMLAKMRKIMGK